MIVDPAVSGNRNTRRTQRNTAFARPAAQADQIDAAKIRLNDWMAYRWAQIKAAQPGSTERLALVEDAKVQIKALVRDPPFGFTSQQVFDWIDARVEEIRAGDIVPPVADIPSVAVGTPSVADDGRLAIAYFGKVFVISAAGATRFSEFIAFPAFQTTWGEECAHDWLARYGTPAVTVLDALPEPWAAAVP